MLRRGVRRASVPAGVSPASDAAAVADWGGAGLAAWRRRLGDLARGWKYLPKVVAAVAGVGGLGRAALAGSWRWLGGLASGMENTCRKRLRFYGMRFMLKPSMR